MNRIMLSILAISATMTLSAQTTMMSWEEAETKARETVARLTLEEKLDMTHGFNKFFLPGVPAKGIPYVYMSDASVGVRIIDIPNQDMIRQPEKTTQFPASILLASTFNPQLAAEYAKAVGEECRMSGVGVLLGPGMNIYRTSQCGRNFEYCGEDPYLAARMVEAYVRGMQETGTVACLKHFLCNNTEFYRRRSNSIVDERAIMEIYTPAFKAGIDAGAGCVMTSYNQLNGEWAGQSSYVIKDLLRGRLGFRGMVMTDWRSIYDWKKVVLSGQNVDMPGDPQFYIKKYAADLVNEGELTEKDIEEMIIPQIATCIRFGLYDRFMNGICYDEGMKARMEEHEHIAYRTACEGTVLLKNNGILPLKKDSKVLLIGRWAKKVPQGGGSSKVKGYDRTSLYMALRRAYGECITCLDNPTDEQIEAASVVICATGTVDSEGTERIFRLGGKDEALVDRAVRLNRNTVVAVFSGSGINMTKWNDQAAAILYCWYPGQNGCHAVREIMYGVVNPSGKLPATIERRFEDSPSYGYLPEGADLKRSAGNPNEKMFQNWTYNITYNEGIMVGYRWYEKKDIKPLYPFGFGLSYTKFQISDVRIVPEKRKRNADAESITVTLKIRNCGERYGKEVIQVYASENAPTVERPVKELKAFAKVELKSGEEKDVTIKVRKADLGFWDTASHSWKTNPGEYTLHVGTSSADIVAKLPFTLN